MSTTTRRRRLSDTERDARRARERELMHQSVTALLTSEGWQNWLAATARMPLSLAEPLLDASEAARILGSIPPKTVLQLAQESRTTGIRAA